MNETVQNITHHKKKLYDILFEHMLHPKLKRR